MAPAAAASPSRRSSLRARCSDHSRWRASHPRRAASTVTVARRVVRRACDRTAVACACLATDCPPRLRSAAWPRALATANPQAWANHDRRGRAPRTPRWPLSAYRPAGSKGRGAVRRAMVGKHAEHGGPWVANDEERAAGGEHASASAYFEEASGTPVTALFAATTFVTPVTAYLEEASGAAEERAAETRQQREGLGALRHGLRMAQRAIIVRRSGRSRRLVASVVPVAPSATAPLPLPCLHRYLVGLLVAPATN